MPTLRNSSEIQLIAEITSWYGKYPIVYGVLYILGVAGFLPSTVLPRDCDYKIGQKFRMTPKNGVGQNFYPKTHKNVGDLKMGVSENNGTPKSSILIGFSSINHPFGVPPFSETPK